jgi:hypothetical protein
MFTFFLHFTQKNNNTMNYAKGKIAESLHVPELVETVRVNGTKQVKKAEKSYPYLHQTLPTSRMTDTQRTKLLKKIKRLAEWLDNAVPHSPIPLGIDSILVSILLLVMYRGGLLKACNRVSFLLLVDLLEAYLRFTKSTCLLLSVSHFGCLCT